MESLTIYGANLVGTVPSQLSLLTMLQSIYFERVSKLSGTFPNIENLTKLSYFGLRSTYFTGPLPNITKCTNLYIYDISGNSFSGKIPLFNSSILNLIDLSENQIKNPIPDNLFLTNVSNELFIKMKSNYINGVLPSILFQNKLVVLDLSYNNISGTIPSEFINCFILEQLILTRNLFSGTIPDFILPNLFKFDIAHNLLTGQIPSFILWNNESSTSNLFKGFIYVNLNDNKLFGVIPSFGNFTAPTSIDLSNNELSLDDESFGIYSDNLTWLNLANNNITTVPSTLNRLNSLISLDLSNCRISGSLPSLLRVQYLKLNNNFLTGDINTMLIDPNYKTLPVFVDLTLNRLNINAIENTSFGVSSVYGSINSEVIINIYPQDVDECLLNINDCQHFCLDGWFPVPGYTCGCQLGFILNKRTCDPICGDGILSYPQEQCDFVHSSFGCSPQCTELFGYKCDDSGCSSICGDNILVNPEECDNQVIGCNKNCTVHSGYTCSNNICQLCTPEEWKPLPFEDNFRLFPKFQSLGYNISSFDFTSCLLCSGGLAIETRNVVNSIYCAGIDSQITVPCSFACSNLSIFTSAKESIYTLQQQLESGNFLNNILSKLFNVNVNITSNQNELHFRFSSYNNINQMANIIHVLALDIVPNIPSLNIKMNNFSIDLSASDPLFSSEKIVGIIISVIVLMLIVLILYYYYSSELHQLPKEISWSFLDKITHPWRWKYHDEYYSRKYKTDSKEFKYVESLLITYFNKGKVKLSRITAIYNKSLTVSFINQWNITITRKIRSSEQFFPITYKSNEDKMKVMEYYKNNILKYDDELVPLVPVLHGTDLEVAKKIAKTGFASLSSLDAGFFGKGIYFTTHLLYTLPYACGKRNPVVILSYVNMGNVYPVTEDHRGSNSLSGAAIKSSYNSHFVLTNKDGTVTNNFDGIICDEIVVGQESQILPAFIIELDVDSCLEELDKWYRVVANVELTDCYILI
jgi:Leucine-rich repeat (LRR) protein